MKIKGFLIAHIMDYLISKGCTLFSSSKHFKCGNNSYDHTFHSADLKTLINAVRNKTKDYVY